MGQVGKPSILVTRKLPASVIEKLAAVADVDVYTGEAASIAGASIRSVETHTNPSVPAIRFRSSSAGIVLASANTSTEPAARSFARTDEGSFRVTRMSGRVLPLR